MGKSLGMIHHPTAGYKEHLDSTMDRFFARMKVHRPVWRLNWGIVDDPALFQSTGHSRGGFRFRHYCRERGRATVATDRTPDLTSAPAQPGYSVYHPDLCKAVDASSPIPRTCGSDGSGSARHARLMAFGIKSLSGFLDAVLGWLDKIGEKDNRCETRKRK